LLSCFVEIGLLIFYATPNPHFRIGICIFEMTAKQLTSFNAWCLFSWWKIHICITVLRKLTLGYSPKPQSSLHFRYVFL